MKEKKAEIEKIKKEEEKEKNLEKGEVVTEDKKAKNYNKQIKIVVFVMAILLVSVFLTYWIVQESKTFEYKGMRFYKEKEGTIIFYKSLLGYVSYSGENVPFVLKLRTDPRKLDEIKVEGQIKNFREEMILSLSPQIANCTNTVRTMVDFSMTFGAFGIKTTAATTDKKYSKENNVPLITCKDAQQKTVIVMTEGEENKIIKTADCYTIEIKNCEIQENFEKFILEFIANSMTKEIV